MTAGSNDNNAAMAAAARREPDAHGQAAFLLVESLIHGLVDRRVISLEAAIEIVEVAVEVKAGIADELGDTPATLRRSLGLLNGLADSLRSDQKP